MQVAIPIEALLGLMKSMFRPYLLPQVLNFVLCCVRHPKIVFHNFIPNVAFTKWMVLLYKNSFIAKINLSLDMTHHMPNDLG